MNKAVRIGAIVLGAILAAALVIFIFFPGLPTYAYVKFKYKNIDKTAGRFETAAVSDDYAEHTINGVTLKAPQSYVQENSTSSALKSEKGAIMVIRNSADDLKKAKEMLGEYDPWDGYKYSESDYRSYFDAAGSPYPFDADGCRDVLWYYRTKLRSSDCIKLRGKDLAVFREFADNKDISMKIEDTWLLEMDGATAYVCHMNDHDTDEVKIGDSDLWTVTIYPDGADHEYFVMLRDLREETAKQVISSVRID